MASAAQTDSVRRWFYRFFQFMPQHRDRADDEQPAQISIALLGDATQALFAAA